MQPSHHGPSPSSIPPPPPPPSRPARRGDPQEAVHQDPNRREQRWNALQPPSLTTNFVQANNSTGLATPVSATSPFSPLSASAARPSISQRTMPVSRSSSGYVAAYNPQEWSNTQMSATQGNHSPAPSIRRAIPANPGQVTGMEAALPSPPPPYSASPQSATPSRAFYTPTSAATSQQASPTFNTVENQAHITSSPQSISNATSQYPTPNSPFNAPPTSFAAPPSGLRDRSSSRTRILAALKNKRPSLDIAGALPLYQPSPQHHTLVNQSPTAAIIGPPAARRAASTGAISSASNSPAPNLREGDVSGNHGFALPPPPPGPPPSSRSQSQSRAYDPTYAESRSNAQLGFARAASNASKLGPVPPTPAGWVDDTSQRPFGNGVQPDNAQRPLDNSPPNNEQTSSSRQSGHYGLPQRVDERVLASNNGSLRELRERRNQSRGNSLSRPEHESLESVRAPSRSDSPETRPANLVLGAPSSSLNRRRHVKNRSRASPTFSETSPAVSDGHLSAQPSPLANVSYHSLETTPRESAPNDMQESSKSALSRSRQNSLRSNVNTSGSLKEKQYTGLRSSSQDTSRNADSFAMSSLDRHRSFLEAEARAVNDTERLELFAAYIVTESRLRRDRYAAAFNQMGGQIFDLTRDMWRKLDKDKAQSKASGSSAGHTTPEMKHWDSQSNFDEPSSAGSQQGGHPYTPATEASSPASVSSQSQKRPESRQNTYQPCLSPIASTMAMSNVPGEGDSRGRSASRWWESETGSTGGGRKVERTKRETKYMGLGKQAMENLQWDGAQQSPATAFDPNAAAMQQYYALGSDEYPEEKVLWHDAAGAPEKIQTPTSAISHRHSKPRADFSRLITLPPPYPRHYPALNNNHPDLATFRALLRALNDQQEIQTIRSKHVPQELPENSSVSITERRVAMRHQIQDDINAGRISFAEAARREAQFDESESKRSRDQAQKGFDVFQKHIMSPLNALYTDRISKASKAIDQLEESLSYDARSRDPSQTQEEGDEQPELLEKLTIFKWLFEARQQMHRDMFSIENESDERYKTVILMPYRLAGNHSKVNEVESFFAKDAHDRKATFQKEALHRFELFLQTVESHVTRGVETQLSAFWDIAPPLLTVIQKVPNNVSDFEVYIPDEDYHESPSYHDYPLQYLYTLLRHAQKSAYQFIESQVNLCCLLHEVKEGVMTTGCKLLETQRLSAGEDPAVVKPEMDGIRKDEGSRLTGDLKERVGLVEDQWRQALGKGFEECQHRVKAFLLEQQGWDEGLDE